MTDADQAEAEALELAEDVRDILTAVRVPANALADWMPERLSFSITRML